MTRSSDFAEPLDLDRGLPTTDEDVRALRRLRYRAPASLADYLRFLACVEPAPGATLRARPGPARGRLFELPPPDPR
ncbi:MAG TPA: hypothetical protein VLA62_10180 [Solirubrobacterales bacterium]|nr:hypothetical protein [Solirubrobacterales bacterium]